MAKANRGSLRGSRQEYGGEGRARVRYLGPHKEPAGDFGDERVILVNPQDPKIPFARTCPDQGVLIWQNSDGPTYIAIGADAPDEKCIRTAARFAWAGITAEMLIAFRANLEAIHG